ncbi:MAG: sugar phosphate isomerase/epimerase [Dysgonamonadaceae bacterium]|jgi:sugar phosphate isomerase/epimerase|nr:sugar phosphate isomerase/epimerase [Dysgonamonadaceae bacterium]
MRTIQFMLLLCATSLFFACTAKKESNPVVNVPEKNIGLQLYSLRGAISDSSVGIDSVIKAVGQMAYKYVETANYSDGKIYEMTPEEFKAKLDAAGLFALSCHVGKALEADMKPVWAWWDQCIAVHKAAGLKYIVVPSMPKPENVKQLQAYCDYFNQIGEKCNAAGLKFGYHNHSAEFETIFPLENAPSDSITWYDYMIQNTDPSKVFFELDVYWSQKGGRLAAELFKQYPGRFDLLHIKDEKELGASGYMDFEALFNNIDPAVKYLIVEVEQYNLPAFESVKASLDYLNNAAFVKEDYSVR